MSEQGTYPQTLRAHRQIDQHSPHQAQALHPAVERDTQDDVVRMPNSTRRYQSQGAGQVMRRHDERRPRKKRFKRDLNPHTYVGAGMVLALSLVLIGYVVYSRGSTLRDDLTYGRPRTYQTDMNVGHGKASSHFIAVNLHRHVEVIEIPEGDPGHSRLYVGPTLTGDGQDEAPVTLAFEDVNGDKKPDMIIKIGTTRYVFLNTGNAFRPKQPDEQVNLSRS